MAAAEIDIERPSHGSMSCLLPTTRGEVAMKTRPDDPKHGDFARGEQTLPRDERIGSFADGEETEPHDERPGSFAKGLETKPRADRVGSFADTDED
jgi:hypothetical protein